MPVTSIDEARARVLRVPCPYCLAAPSALCTESIHNAAGIQTNFTNIFHAERIIKAQTLSEKALDMTRAIQNHLERNPLK